MTLAEVRAWITRNLEAIRSDEDLETLLDERPGDWVVIHEGIALEFVTRFEKCAAFAAWTGTCPVDELFPLGQLCRVLARRPPCWEWMSQVVAPCLEVGMFAEWAKVVVKGHMAPHPLRQDMARAWLRMARSPVDEETFQRVLLDKELVLDLERAGAVRGLYGTAPVPQALGTQSP